MFLDTNSSKKANSMIGFVQVPGTKPEVVPAGQTLVLEGSINSRELCSDKWVLMEAPFQSSLPGGLLCASFRHAFPEIIPKNPSDSEKRN